MPKTSAKLTQAERAYNAIKRAILEGQIEEGIFLSETDIIKRYGIGRTPYREACNRLHHEGLLQVVPRRGYFIPEISFQAVCDLFETRMVLEDAIAQLAAIRSTDQELEQLEKLSATAGSGGGVSQAARLIQLNTEFHLRLAAMTRNRQLVELLKQNLEKTERLMYIELRSHRFQDSDFHTMHQHIVNALRSRDPLRARAAVFEDIADAQRASMVFTGSSGMQHPILASRAAAARKAEDGEAGRRKAP